MKTYTYTDKENKLHIYHIRRLTGEDVLTTRSLWEEVFSEDSPAFTDYYFAKKASHNITFVCRLSDADSECALSSASAKNNPEIISMVHLTPYEMVIDGKIIPTFYMVGVATKENHRHRGLMAALLQEAFAYAAKVKVPFIFLMPTDPAIYEPFGFSYIYSRPEYDVPDILSPNEVYINSFLENDIRVHFIEFSNSDVDLCKLSSFANETLRKNYDYYLNRTPLYYETLLAELESQNGGIFVFTKADTILGYFLYAKEKEKAFIQEVLFSQDFLSSSDFGVMSTYLPVEKKEKKPIIMAKNLNISYPNTDIFASSFEANSDYVNLLSNLKGCINEIV